MPEASGISVVTRMGKLYEYFLHVHEVEVHKVVGPFQFNSYLVGWRDVWLVRHPSALVQGAKIVNSQMRPVLVS